VAQKITFVKSISKLVSDVRDLINAPRKQCVLLENLANWKMLCSCLDAIGDTELAFVAFLKQRKTADYGQKYLSVYGVLQAMFVQQDAVENLAEALDINYAPDPQLKQIVEIRNNSVGHPTKRGKGKGNAYNFISRISLTNHSFDLLTMYADGHKQQQFQNVNVAGLISKQQATLKKELANIITELKKEDMEHKRKFKGEKLQELFSSHLHYYFEKIYEACSENQFTDFGTIGVEGIFEYLEKLKTALEKRNALKAYDSVNCNLDLIEYPLTELKKFFKNLPSTIHNRKSAYIFAFFIREHLDALQETLKYIDEEYASKT
jgi:hypothetical protein